MRPKTEAFFRKLITRCVVESRRRCRLGSALCVFVGCLCPCRVRPRIQKDDGRVFTPPQRPPFSSRGVDTDSAGRVGRFQPGSESCFVVEGSGHGFSKTTSAFSRRLGAPRFRRGVWIRIQQAMWGVFSRAQNPAFSSRRAWARIRQNDGRVFTRAARTVVPFVFVGFVSEKPEDVFERCGGTGAHRDLAAGI